MAVKVLVLIFSIVVHEVAHGWAALRLGDDTAYRMGRLTLNPIPHIDPIGTVVVPALALATTGFLFGWAKPVPVAMRNLRNPRRDMMFVAAAGPGANLLMALFWAFFTKLIAISGLEGMSAVFFLTMGQIGVFINEFVVLSLTDILH